MIYFFSSEIRIDMEPILHKWSVESTLASLFGDSYDFDDDLDNFIKHVHDMFDFSAILQTKSAEMECKENTADWQGFSQAAHGALSFFQQKLATCKVKFSFCAIQLSLHKNTNNFFR